MICKGYRFDVAGGFGCDFYDAEGERICYVSGLFLPYSSLALNGWDLAWDSEFDPDTTIFPGVRRIVTDHMGWQAAEIIFRGRGLFDIKCRGRFIRVQSMLNQCLFLRNGRPVALTKRILRTPDLFEEYPDATPRLSFQTALPDKLEPTLKLLILAFPLLQFGL